MNDTRSGIEDAPQGTELSAAGVIFVGVCVLVLVAGILSPYIYEFYRHSGGLLFGAIVAVSALVAAFLFLAHYSGPAPEPSQGVAGLDSGS